MPIYEFYCPDCHVLLSFLSRRVDTSRRPACPRCGRPRLERRPSSFAISRGRREEPEGASPGVPDLDDARLERAMESMAGELESLDDDDPRQAARAMRRLYETAGLPLDAATSDALRRMESGEDPESIDEDFDEDAGVPAAESAGARAKVSRVRRRWLPPEVDPHLYEMD